MKSLLIGFFQVLCFLQVFWNSQLNTYPADKANSFSSVSTINFIPVKQSQNYVAPAHHVSGLVIKTTSSIPFEETELIFENIEEETEDFSEKHIYNNLYFAGIPVDQSLDYLYGNGKTSALFCEQLSFISLNKRHLVFQVFRI